MRLRTITALVAFAAVFIAVTQAQTPLALERTIALPGVHGRIDHMAIDGRRQRLFVAALGSDAVEVIDLRTTAVVHTISGLAEPQGIGFDPDHNRIWIANGRDGSLRIYDGQSFALLHTIALGDDADNIRRDAKTGRMIVGYGRGEIGMFDADAREAGKVKLDAHPESFQVEPNGSRMYVNLPDSHKIAVLDEEQRQLRATWGTGGARSNFPMALDAGDHRLFVVCRSPAVLLVLDTDSGRIVQTLPTVGDSDDVFYDGALRRVYVSGGQGAISVYQQQGADQYFRMADTKTSPGARTSLFVPGLSRLFLAVREYGTKPAAIEVFATTK